MLAIITAPLSKYGNFDAHNNVLVKANLLQSRPSKQR